MNELTAVKVGPAVLVPLQRKVLDALGAMSNAIETTPGGRSCLPFKSAPSKDQRRWLEQRAGEIEAYLAPCSAAKLLDELTIVFASMATRSGTAADNQITLKAYVANLGDLPFFAVQRSCRAYLRGEVGEGKWVPSIADLRELAKRFMKPAEEEGDKIKAILVAMVLPPRNESLREKAMAHMRETAEILKSTDDKLYSRNPRPREATRAEANDWLDQQKANGGAYKLPALSPLARASLGLGNGQQFEEQSDG